MKSQIWVSLCILVLEAPKAHPAPAPMALHMLVASPSPCGLSRVQWIECLLSPQQGTAGFVGQTQHRWARLLCPSPGVWHMETPRWTLPSSDTPGAQSLAQVSDRSHLPASSLVSYWPQTQLPGGQSKERSFIADEILSFLG